MATPIIEVKNLNSFRGVERAMKYEADRQFREYARSSAATGRCLMARERHDPARSADCDDGKLVEVAKATAGWDDGRGVTEVQRRKEEAADYRYFPEPDLVPVVVDAAWLERSGPTSANSRRPRSAGCRTSTACRLRRRRARAPGPGLRRPISRKAVRLCGDAKAVSNWTTNQVLPALNERKVGLRDFRCRRRRWAT